MALQHRAVKDRLRHWGAPVSQLRIQGQIDSPFIVSYPYSLFCALFNAVEQTYLQLTALR
jgi:hypothetical protein